jgi:hypothetical protein
MIETWFIVRRFHETKGSLADVSFLSNRAQGTFQVMPKTPLGWSEQGDPSYGSTYLSGKIPLKRD